MADYRAYIVVHDGHITGFEPLVCADDTEAIEMSMGTMSNFGAESV